MTLAEAAKGKGVANGDIANAAATMGRRPIMAPLYMSCRNINGKLGLSVGCSGQSMPQTNGAR